MAQRCGCSESRLLGEMMDWPLMPLTKPFGSLRESGQVVVLDGGLATELEAAGKDLDHALWSGRVVAEDPAAVQAVHTRYLAAGAEILTTSSYQLSFAGLSAQGVATRESESLLRRSSDLALAARNSVPIEGRWAIVAASVGSYGAFLCDGSEYRGNYDVDDEDLRVFHAERLRILAQSGVDLLAIETIPSEQEAQVLLDLLAELEGSAWLSFTLRDEESLSDGSRVQGLVERLRSRSPRGFDKIVALGFNCVPPSLLQGAADRLHRETELPLILYPNSGETYCPETRTWRVSSWASMGGSAEAWPLEQWRDLGVRIVGGCCRIGSSEIQLLRARIDDLNQRPPDTFQR